MAKPTDHTIASSEIDLLPARTDEAKYAGRQSALGFAFDLQKGMHYFANDRVTPFTPRPNIISIIPTGCDAYSQSSCGREYMIDAIDR